MFGDTEIEDALTLEYMKLYGFDNVQGVTGPNPHVSPSRRLRGLSDGEAQVLSDAYISGLQ